MLGPFAGQVRDINSIVLLCNGISFAIQAVMFLMIGSFADYGTWRPWINVSFTVLAWGISFGWLGVETPDKWQIAAALYIMGLIAYQGMPKGTEDKCITIDSSNTHFSLK
jgi:MFS-type transporter involved in bile tolerance (Atg22 family)